MPVNNNQKFINKNKNGNNFSIFSYATFFATIIIIGSSIIKFDKNSENIESLKDYNYLISNEKYTDIIVKKLENKFNIKINENEKDELLMLNAIYENDNLDDNIKNIFYSFYPIITDCTYMLRDEAYKSLTKVDVIYKERDENISPTVMGDYSSINGIINIYKENDEDNKILTHEGVHCIFSNEITNNLPRYFREGMTQLIRNEYFSDDPFYEFEYYAYEVAYVKMLSELVGSDLVLKAFCTGNFSTITKYMDMYNDNEISSDKILDIYEDSLQHFEKDTDFKYSNNEKYFASEALYNIYTKMNRGLYGYNEFIYLNNLTNGIFEESPVNYYTNYIIYNGILEKVYFSKELQEKFPTTEFKDYNNRNKVQVKSIFK